MYSKCQIFTPNNYVHELLNSVNYITNVYGKKFLENSCGDGNILKEVVHRYIVDAIEQGYSLLKIKKGLESDIYGYEIDKNHYNNCIKNLNEVVGRYNLSNIKWNIYNKDYLFSKSSVKYDFIVGNPPYLQYVDLEDNLRDKLKRTFSSCKVGKFDYCFAFIEKSLNQLTARGKIAYLIPGSIFKTVFGKKIRSLMCLNLISIKDYKDVQVFNNALVKSAIVVIDNEQVFEHIEYINMSTGNRLNLQKNRLGDKWVFSELIVMDGARLGDYFKVSSTIATLFNEAFIIKDKNLTKNGYISNGIRLEPKLIYKAYSPKSIRYKRNEFIIFPYIIKKNGIQRISEGELESKYNGVWRYLSNYKKRLLNRDSDTHTKWYEYGRSQALKLMGREKLLISSIITEAVFAYSLKRNDIPYSGLIVTQKDDSNIPLALAKAILESDDFFSYIKNIGVPLNGKSFRITSKDIENYIVREI